MPSNDLPFYVTAETVSVEYPGFAPLSTLLDTLLKQEVIGWLTPSNVLPLFDITENKAIFYALCSAVKGPIPNSG